MAHNGIARAVHSYFYDMTNEEYAASGMKNCQLREYNFDRRQRDRQKGRQKDGRFVQSVWRPCGGTWSARVDIYLIPTSDYHSSEYVGDCFKERAFLTGFTGSAGTAVVARMRRGFGPTAGTLSG